MKPLKDRLFDECVLEKNSAEILAFKSQYRKDYQHFKHQEYATKYHRKTLLFTKAEFARLQTEAAKHQLKLSPFLKASIFATLNQVYLCPDDQTIRQIETSVRTCENQLTALFTLTQRPNIIQKDEFAAAKQQLQQLEQQLSHILRHPPTLDHWLQTQHQNSAEFLPTLLRSVAQLLSSPE